MKNMQKKASENYVSPTIAIDYMIVDAVCSSGQIEFSDGDIGGEDIFSEQL